MGSGPAGEFAGGGVVHSDHIGNCAVGCFQPVVLCVGQQLAPTRERSERSVEPSLWRDMTVNSAIPAAEKESVGGGMFRLSFGPARAGEPIELKFDGQIIRSCSAAIGSESRCSTVTVPSPRRA